MDNRCFAARKFEQWPRPVCKSVQTFEQEVESDFGGGLLTHLRKRWAVDLVLRGFLNSAEESGGFQDAAGCCVRRSQILVEPVTAGRQNGVQTAHNVDRGTRLEDLVKRGKGIFRGPFKFIQLKLEGGIAYR